MIERPSINNIHIQRLFRLGQMTSNGKLFQQIEQKLPFKMMREEGSYLSGRSPT